MVKFYSNRNVQAVRGPITVVAGRSRRVTFVECPNTLTAMCDVAKVADLILLMVDGSFGFEMETFEFLNISQVHGFPRMFGVVSHLDQLKTGKALKKRKKFLRHRFWHEVAAGAKLMCLAPMVRGMYRSTDVLKLHRLLICVEPKIQNWRNTHSCVLIDRYEDITAPQDIVEDANCNRTIAFYGYARGKPLKSQQVVHIPGLGDFPIAHISKQEDPCAMDDLSHGTSQGHKMRHLGMKQKRIYAPYCNVSGVMYDDDAIYIQEDAEKGMIERSGEGLQYLRELQRAKPMDAAAAALDVVRRPVVFRDEDTMELAMDAVEAPSDDDDDGGSSSSSGSSSTGGNGAAEGRMPRNDLSLYGPEAHDEEEARASDAAEAGESLAPRGRNAPDAVRENVVRHDWSDAALLRRLKNLFVTGDWGYAARAAEDGGEGEEERPGSEASRGYESEDEEFDAIVRGEKPLPSSAVQPEEDREGHSSADAEWEEEEGRERRGRRRVDALAAVGHGASSSPAWGAFRPSDDTTPHRGGWTASRKKDPRGADSEGSDYDILAEDDVAVSKSAFADTELDELVSTFLAPRQAATTPTTTTAASGVPPSLRNNDDDGAIQFYDPHQSRADGDSQRNPKTHNHNNGNNNNNDDAAEEEDVLEGKTLTEEQERLLQKKMAKKKDFDASYDMGDRSNTYSHYHQLTRAVEEKKQRLDAALQEMGEDVAKKIQLVGYFSGLYVRFVLENVPVEFVRLFDPTTPLIAGGVNAGEDQFQIVHARLKRHRWYPKILKAQDPLLLSMGWRRFQTQPIFATEDPNGRVRYLKYTPQHMHCVAAFYAPVAPTNTGFIAIPVKEQRSPNFRISCTGYTLGNDHATNIVKKLKLTGTPNKIMKTTVFVKGMFNSDIEATKFVGAKLKSVSGIRGIVKAAFKGKDGLVRATFEDKLLPSDIVFCRAWKTVHPPKYCSTQRNLVDANWVGMRSMRELRWEHNVPLATKTDSEYHEIKRRQRADEEHEGADAGKDAAKVLLSRNQKLQLPFNMKEEFIPLERTTAVQQRIAGAVTVAPEPRDMRRTALLDAFTDKADAMLQKKEEAKKRSRLRRQRESAVEEEEYMRQLKKAKKETARLREFRSQHKSRK
ncbi:ribosome biogenesis protein BMS1 [Trypanosoma conorhini]|uniref:Ribosome biogenesis protein BMS1 n=1 Tax=Trypanosoma conorhini TaxID=83891 RepID=A0A422QC66_9TRYP|nr:ribosome biogenesis protein BMS1 [Trypanosoma conorhini]RNF27525.1 ribosome biogenesis protein BMS1 [Trypanosoma conorhini]